MRAILKAVEDQTASTGKTYKKLTIETNNKQWSINVFNNVPGYNNLGTTYKPDSEIELTTEKKGTFLNVTAVGAATEETKRTAPPATRGKTNQPRSTYTPPDTNGMQVGNALTNAATLLAAGVTANKVKAMAEELLRIGEELKARLPSIREQVVAQKPAQANSEPQQNYDVVEGDEVMF